MSPSLSFANVASYDLMATLVINFTLSDFCDNHVNFSPGDFCDSHVNLHNRFGIGR
jgi:hypothetical protein